MEKIARQQGDVLGAFPQRRHGQGQHIEAIVQVLAKALGAEAGLQVLVGRGDDPDIDGLRVAGADRADLAALQAAQQFGLDGGADVADLIEMDGAAVGGGEQAPVVAVGPGEGASDVAESSLSSRFSGIEGQLTATNGLSALVPIWWIKRAASSLPVPDSPRISTV